MRKRPEKGNAPEVAATEASSVKNQAFNQGIDMANSTQVVASSAMTPDLSIVDGQITTTSQQIAEHFGKRHADVIRAIRKLDAPGEFTERNFALSEFKDSTGRALPAYRITRDGFTLLAMGFTGKEAMQWKVAYLTAFNQMEQELLARTTRPANPVIDYERISPAQAQDLKEIINACVAAKVFKTYAEGWARLHNKFKVNSYLQLPAARHWDARQYLIAKLPKGMAGDVVEDEKVTEPTSYLRARVGSVKRGRDGDWCLYVVSGDCGFGVQVSRKAMRAGGVQSGDVVRLEYLKKDNPLCGPFTRVTLWDECQVPEEKPVLLPESQAKEITERLDRLGHMFHPFSSQFADVMGVLRALRGIHPKLAAREPSYRQVLALPDNSASGRQVPVAGMVAV